MLGQTKRRTILSTGCYATQRIAYRITHAPVPLRDLFDAVSRYLQGLGDDVQMKELKYYIAYKRIKNFACVEVFPQVGFVAVYLKVDPRSVTLEGGFTRDVAKISIYGTGDLEVRLRSMEDFTRAQPLFVRSYEGS